MIKTAKKLLLSQESSGATTDASHFHVGTLIYSRAGIVVLFSWLLAGSFIITLMEKVMPTLLPLVLRDNGASNQAIAFIVSSLYMMVNMIANPIISYKSDRFRGRWGRRRPFILWTTPFVVLFLMLIPFTPQIAQTIEKIDWLASFLKNSPITTLILVSGIVVTAYQIFHMFVASIYYYLVVDVVPETFIARFYGLFQICGSSAGFVFHYFIFGMAKTYMSEIFIGISLTYGIFITLMCWKVKEGEYPPANKREESDRWWSGIRNYAVECFGCPLFLLIFMVYSIPIWSNVADVFLILLYRDQMGLTLSQIGKVNAFIGIASIIIVYPVGILIDRLGSHKSLMIGMVGYAVIKSVSFMFANSYWTLIMCSTLWVIPYTLVYLSAIKWTVDLYPRKLYGQFGSAGAMVSSIGAVMLAPMLGLFFDWVQNYRYALLSPVIFQIVGFLGALIIYRKWKALGGQAGYQAQYE